jgi:hypothetical protein
MANSIAAVNHIKKHQTKQPRQQWSQRRGQDALRIAGKPALSEAEGMPALLFSFH